MTFSPPGNPVKRQPARIRQFDGVSGPDDKVLRRKNEKGWDLSGNVANEVYDFSLGRRGVMRLRLGSRKINDTGKNKTIEGILPIRIAGNLSYGIIYNEILEIISMPTSLKKGVPVIDMTPAEIPPVISNEMITAFPGELL